MTSNAGIRVLVVDDHPTMLWGISRLIEGEQPILELAGIAATAKDALRLTVSEQPDVVLLDLDLGETSALDIIPQIRRRSRAKVLILSGLRDREQLQRAMLLGASGLLAKTEPAETIVTAIQRVHAGEIWLDRASTGDLFETLRNRPEPPQPGGGVPLTARERAIILALGQGQGLPNKLLARQVGMGEHTLRNHLSTIYSKLGVRNRLALYQWALENGMLNRS